MKAEIWTESEHSDKRSARRGLVGRGSRRALSKENAEKLKR